MHGKKIEQQPRDLGGLCGDKCRTVNFLAVLGSQKIVCQQQIHEFVGFGNLRIDVIHQLCLESESFISCNRHPVSH